MPTFALIILCIMAYFVVGIALAALFECNGMCAMPGASGPWETVDRGMFIAMWPFMLVVHLVCFLMRGPAWTARGLVQGCKKRQMTRKEREAYENSWRD